jgi:hypothetical protein
MSTSTVVARIYPVKSSFDPDLARMTAVLAVIETPAALALFVEKVKGDSRGYLAGAKFLALGEQKAPEQTDLSSDAWFLTDSDDDVAYIEGLYR